jgi:hypothetical protein
MPSWRAFKESLFENCAVESLGHHPS